MANNPPLTYTDKFLLKDVLDTSGNVMPTRQFIQIVGSGVLQVTDDPENNTTVVEVQAGGSAGQGTTTVANGLNSNVPTVDNPTLRLAGPNGVFSVDGFTVPGAVAPLAGQTLDVVNTTAQIMTLVHEGTGSTAMYRIAIGTGAPIRLPPKATARLVYDGTLSRWRLQNAGAAYVRELDVRDLGAQVDGATDDLAAVLASLATASALGCGVVRVPAGTLKITGPIVHVAGVKLLGAGQGATTIMQATPGAHVIEIVDVTDATVEGMTLQSAGAADAVLISAVVNGLMYHPTLRNVKVAGYGAPGKAASANVGGDSINCTAHGFANGTRVRFTGYIGGQINPTPTFAASANLVDLTAHGLVAGDPVVFNDNASGTLPAGVNPRQVYYVIASGLTANAFEFSATSGGSAVAFTGTGSPNVNHSIWAVVPQGLQPYFAYYVVNASTNAFQVSATVGGSPIALTGIATSSCMVGQVFAGVHLLANGANVYDAHLEKVWINGGLSTLTDGGARYGVISEGLVSNYDVVHAVMHEGEISNVHCGAMALVGGELWLAETHIYNVADGAGGGTALYSGGSTVLTTKALRFETPAIDLGFVADANSYGADLQGTPAFQRYQVVDLGSASSYRLSLGGGTNVQAGQFGFPGGVVCHSIQPDTGSTIAIGNLTINSGATTDQTFPNGIVCTDAQNTGFHILTGRFVRPDGAGLAIQLKNGEIDTFGDFVEAYAAGGAFGAWAQSAPTVATSGGGAITVPFAGPPVETANTAMIAQVHVTARATGGSAVTVGDAACFVRDVLVKNVAGTVSIVGSASGLGTDIKDTNLSTLGGPSFSIAASALVVSMTGIANANLTWSVYVKWKALNF